MTADVKKLTGSEVEITGEIAASDFEGFRASTMDELRGDVEIQGFRKGHAPDNLLVEKVGAETILYEMAEKALSHFYPQILSEQKIDAIGRPEITITKLAADNPLGFKIKTAIMPQVDLPNYAKIAKEEMAKPIADYTATEEELNKILTELRQRQAKKNSQDPAAEIPETDLPTLDDEFAKSLGQFETLADLTAQIKNDVEHDKKHKAEEKRRLNIMEQIIAGAKMELPATLIEGEVKKMGQEMRSQFENMGLKYEDYLTHLKKTEAELETEWRPEAEKRVKFGLVLAEIAKREKITPEADKLAHETEHLLTHYPEANPEQVKSYVENLLVNDGVFQFLENQK